MAMSEAHKRAAAKYQKKLKQFHCVFHLEKDADVIYRLEHVENKNGYVRDLVRRDIEKSKTE